MMVTRTSLGAFFVLLVAAAGGGCGKDSETAAATSQGSSPKSNPSVLKLDLEMAKGILVEEVSQVSLPITLKAFGKIQFNEDRMAQVLAPLPGHVVRFGVKVGDEVRQEDTLFQISSRDVSSSVAEYIESKKDLELSEKTFAMTKDLFESQAASAISFKQAEN